MGARILNYGDFGVEVSERGLVVGGTTLEPARVRHPPADRQPLAPHRGHARRDDAHRVSRRHARSRPRQKTFGTVTTGELLGARIPAGANVVYDDLALYGRALDAATVTKHFDASGNARPVAPANVRATGDANALTVDWAAPGGTGPQGQRPIDNYVVEAWQGTTLRGAQAVDGDRRTATLSGLPAGVLRGAGARHQRVRHRPGRRPRRRRSPASPPPTRAQSPPTRRSSTGASASAAARCSPTRPASTIRRSCATPANVVTKASGLLSDADSAFGDGRAWYSSAYDLIRAPLAAGLPTGDRTVEALVKADAPGARIVIYGDFGIEVNERGLLVGGVALNLPDEDDRRLTDNKFHHLVVTYAGTTLTAYLDGEALASAPKTFATTTTGELFAARIPAGANVVYDELAIYDKALDAATVQNHFAALRQPRAR